MQNRPMIERGSIRGSANDTAGAPTISVVIPVYNSEALLSRCIASVAAQTLQPVEVIVVDDGSADRSAEIAEKLGAKVIRNVHKGVSAARNAGIRLAQGEWIALLDSDDAWASDKLERQAEAISVGVVLVYTGRRNFDESGTQSFQWALEPDEVDEKIRFRNPITTSSVLVSKKAILKTHGFREDLQTCEDWECWFRLRKIGRFAAACEPLTYYDVRPQSLSSSPSRMLEGLDSIIDTTLLPDLHGMRRWIWKRRIRSAQMCSAALIARDNHHSGEVALFIKSVVEWPSLFWMPNRFAMLAVSINRLFVKCLTVLCRRESNPDFQA